MTAASETKVFGFSVKVNPRLLIVGLLAIAALLFWSQSRDGARDGMATAAGFGHGGAMPMSPIPKTRARIRRVAATNNENKLELPLVDVTRSDVDPTLRLDLLSRLQSMPEPGKIRNVFETVKSSDAVPKLELQVPISAPVTAALPPSTPVIVEPPFAVDLKYCGFVKSPELGKDRRGFFLDGDKVLIGSEGDVLRYKYRIVGLTTATAEVEDLERKKRQTLTLIANEATQ